MPGATAGRSLERVHRLPPSSIRVVQPQEELSLQTRCRSSRGVSNRTTKSRSVSILRQTIGVA